MVVTIARAIELKHNASLIAALAFETANFYQRAGECACHRGGQEPGQACLLSNDWRLSLYADHTLNSLDPDYSSKWRKYLQLKQMFYIAYVRSYWPQVHVGLWVFGLIPLSERCLGSLQAYCYHGQTLLASDKCGEAIRSLQEAEKCEYDLTGPGGSSDTLSNPGILLTRCWTVTRGAFLPLTQATPEPRYCAKSTVRPRVLAALPSHPNSFSFWSWAAWSRTPWRSARGRMDLCEYLGHRKEAKGRIQETRLCCAAPSGNHCLSG